jgi:hypothetical protein
MCQSSICDGTIIARLSLSGNGHNRQQESLEDDLGFLDWQAMSRVWRPGQTRKVKISSSPRCSLSPYSGTLEEKALSRMGRKMMAGQLLYGEDVTSALVEDTGDASLVIDLIRAIQDEEELAIPPDTQIFGPMGSPTMRSRPLTTAEQWLQDRGLTMADVKPRRSRRKKTAVPENQLSFLDGYPRWHNNLYICIAKSPESLPGFSVAVA